MGLFRTDDPRTQTLVQADGQDAYLGRDELGFPVYRPVVVTEEEQHAKEVEGLRRELVSAD